MAQTPFLGLTLNEQNGWGYGGTEISFLHGVVESQAIGALLTIGGGIATQYGENSFKVTAGTGLNVSIAAGSGIVLATGGACCVERAAPLTLPVPANSTSYIHAQMEAGTNNDSRKTRLPLLIVSNTATEPNALRLARVVTGVSTITTIDDLRKLAPPLRVRGAWEGMAIYDFGEVVTDAGRIWMARRTSQGVTPMAGDDWLLLVDKGPAGPQGEPGLQGEQGPPGASGSGSGDMLVSIYDTDGDGVVNEAEIANSVEWDNVQNVPTATAVQNGVVRFAANGNATPDRAVLADDERLSDPRPPADHTHDASAISEGTLDSARLPDSGAVAGSYTNANITVSAKGCVTAASSGAAGGGVTFTTITGNETLIGLDVGQSAQIYVSHPETDFALCEYPTIAAPQGVDVRVIAHGATSETNVSTDKTGFVMEVRNVNNASYGGDFVVNWTRTGIL